MESKLKTYNFAESPICDGSNFVGNPENVKDVLKFIENKIVNDIFNETNFQREHKGVVVNLNVMGKLIFY